MNDLHTWAGIGLNVQMTFPPVFNQSSSQGSGRVAREHSHTYFDVFLKRYPFALNLGTCKERESVSWGRFSSCGTAKKKKKKEKVFISKYSVPLGK